MKLFCKLGLHDWEKYDEWFPSFNARIIRKYIFHCKCRICGKDKSTIFEFDEKGYPII